MNESRPDKCKGWRARLQRKLHMMLRWSLMGVSNDRISTPKLKSLADARGLVDLLSTTFIDSRLFILRVLQLKNMDFSELTANFLDSIKADWLAAVDADEHEIFKAEYHRIFRAAESSVCLEGPLSSRFNVPLYFSVADDSKCWALVEVTCTKNGRGVWVKMRDIYMSPNIEIADDTVESTAKRFDVFNSALVGIFGLTRAFEYADTVKVYGRTDSVLSFLRGMHDAFGGLGALGTLKGVAVAIEGRWLVFRTTKSNP
jgi:hypothetical protein